MLRRNLPPVKHDIVKQDILHEMILIKSDKLYAGVVFDDVGLPVGTVQWLGSWIMTPSTVTSSDSWANIVYRLSDLGMAS